MGRKWLQSLFVVAASIGVIVAGVLSSDGNGRDNGVAVALQPNTGNDIVSTSSSSSSTNPAPTTSPTSSRPPTTQTQPRSSPAARAAITTTRPPSTTIPAGMFLTTFEGTQYICRDALGSFDKYDCAPYYSQGPLIAAFELAVFTPALYCSGSESSPICSKLWYPKDLQQHIIATSVKFNLISRSGTYICQRALSGYSFDDHDCTNYTGGNPNLVGYLNALKCTRDAFGFNCRTDYYPSEIEGLEIRSISSSKVVCRTSFTGYECFKWSGYGSPRSAIGFAPDYYCNSYWTCDTSKYS